MSSSLLYDPRAEAVLMGSELPLLFVSKLCGDSDYEVFLIGDGVSSCC